MDADSNIDTSDSIIIQYSVPLDKHFVENTKIPPWTMPHEGRICDQYDNHIHTVLCVLQQQQQQQDFQINKLDHQINMNTQGIFSH